MKKIHLSILFSSILISALAFAKQDLTLIGHLQPKETKTSTLNLTPGKLHIEVYSTDHQSKLSCQFIDADSGLVSVEQKDVTRCVGNLASKVPVKLNVKISNQQTNLVDYRITVKEE
jgi:hypothetical protein